MSAYRDAFYVTFYANSDVLVYGLLLMSVEIGLQKLSLFAIVHQFSVNKAYDLITLTI